MSNFDLRLSETVKFVLKCIAALDIYEVEELAREISQDDAERLEIQLLDEAIATREAWGGGTVFSHVAEEFRRTLEADPEIEIDCDLLDFDHPDFLERLNTDEASLSDRKRLFVRLWDGFEPEDKRAFLSRVDPKRVFRQVTS